MATRLKVVEDVNEERVGALEVSTDLAPAPNIPQFDIAPTRNRHSGWTAERQRTFIERVALTGNIGEACACAGLSSTSFYRLCSKPGAESFVAAFKAARMLASTRASAIAWDRAVNGRVERFYKDGELVMERRIPSDHLLTWLLARLDPLTFGSPAAKAQAAVAGDPVEQARKALPQLLAGLADVPPEECECDEGAFIDGRLGEIGDDDSQRGD